eukprot:GHVO01014703.1.p1 GENE.GHVO01014703.1~~GHVO01014703.1.p1  ORF type:complete len:639 (+),score=125.04 GHVO01014703.1:26-1918(+)
MALKRCPASLIGTWKRLPADPKQFKMITRWILEAATPATFQDAFSNLISVRERRWGVGRLAFVVGSQTLRWIHMWELKDEPQGEILVQYKKAVEDNNYDGARHMMVFYRLWEVEFDVIETYLKDAPVNASAALANQLPNADQYRRYLIRLLSTRQNAKTAGRLLRTWKFDADDFPELCNIADEACVNFLMNKCKYQTSQLFELLEGDVALTLILCKKMMNINIGHCLAGFRSLPPGTPIPNRSLETYEVLLKMSQFDKNVYTLPPLPSEEPAPGSITLADVGYDQTVVLVDSPEKGCQVLEIMRRNEQYLGMDAEWRAVGTSVSGSSRIAILQVGAPRMKQAYIFDLHVMRTKPGYATFLNDLSSILVDERVLKIGFDFESVDMSMLRSECAAEAPSTSMDLDNYIDITKILKAYKKGLGDVDMPQNLSAVVELFLNKPMDKTLRMTNWNIRPLTRHRLAYAAMDAAVLYPLLEALRQGLNGECKMGEFLSEFLTRRPVMDDSSGDSIDDNIVPRIKSSKGATVPPQRGRAIPLEQQRWAAWSKANGGFRFLIPDSMQDLGYRLKALAVDLQWANTRALRELAEDGKRVVILDSTIPPLDANQNVYYLNSSDAQSQIRELVEVFRLETET